MDIYKKIKIYGIGRSVLYVVNELYLRFWKQKVLKSYSQSGEDIVIDRLLKGKKRGMYLDVGAYDPVRYSNTKRFYDRGWKGINIEPDRKNYSKFEDQRKRDTNLNMGISEKSGKILFYQFTPDTLSTFSKKEADKYVKEGYILNAKKEIAVNPLAKVLQKHIKGRIIDFATIDTEGLDLVVLKSNNWMKFRPRIICIETKTHTKNPSKSKHIQQIDDYLLEQGYSKRFDNGLNSIFVDDSRK